MQWQTSQRRPTLLHHPSLALKPSQPRTMFAQVSLFEWQCISDSLYNTTVLGTEAAQVEEGVQAATADSGPSAGAAGADLTDSYDDWQLSSGEWKGIADDIAMADGDNADLNAGKQY